jgi:hypothetical protein
VEWRCKEWRVEWEGGEDGRKETMEERKRRGGAKRPLLFFVFLFHLKRGSSGVLPASVEHKKKFFGLLWTKWAYGGGIVEYSAGE